MAKQCPVCGSENTYMIGDEIGCKACECGKDTPDRDEVEA